MLCGVTLARSLTRASVARARAAGFEMLWSSREASVKATRGQPLVLTAELRNRDNLPTRFRKLLVDHAPGLQVDCQPSSGEVPPHGSLKIKLTIVPLRVGPHGIFSLTMQTVRAPGLFSVPLSFSNPYVIEVLPKTTKARLSLPRAGRSALLSAASNQGRKRGNGSDFRELREHRPGDPYKHIAWKASARRGRLLVIEKEQTETDIVWLLVEMSVDSAFGHPGHAAMDEALDAAASLCHAHLAQGDQVGLALIGNRVLYKLLPGRGTKQSARIVSAICQMAHTLDADRSDWDEADVAQRVLEHARTIDQAVGGEEPFDYGRLAEHAARIMGRAPKSAMPPWAPRPSDRILRQYLLSFGIHSPARSTSDREATQRRIAEFLDELYAKRPRPSLVYLVAETPELSGNARLLRSLRRFVGRRTELRIVATKETLPQDQQQKGKGRILKEALELQRKLAAEHSSLRLARMGVGQLSVGDKRSALAERSTSSAPER